MHINILDYNAYHSVFHCAYAAKPPAPLYCFHSYKCVILIIVTDSKLFALVFGLNYRINLSYLVDQLAERRAHVHLVCVVEW